MHKRIEEQTVIFFTIIKWIILATMIGILVGLSTTVFIKLLDFAISLAHRNPYYYFALPSVFVLTAWIANKFAPTSKGHGTEKVIEAVHKRSGKINLAVVPVKLFNTILTIAFGGSAGKEGPSGQIGAGLASFFSDLMKLSKDQRKKLVICGISAGFAAIFGTPISGALFGLEVLYVGAVMYEVMLPAFISGIVAYEVCSSLGMTYFHSTIDFAPQFTRSFFIIIVLSGIVFGSISFLFIESSRSAQRFISKWKINEYLKNALGGLSLALLIFLFSTRYAGLGVETIEGLIDDHQPAFWYDFLLKIVFTIVTLSFGGSGGVVTPTFFIGATAGCFFAQLIGMDTATFAAIGMVSLLAGAANTPIAASIMGLEIFGARLAPFAAISCVISFLMTGHRSIFPSQILSVKKSASFDMDVGKEINEADPRVKREERFYLYRFWQIWKWKWKNRNYDKDEK